MQHPRLRVCQIKPAPRPRDGDVHKPPLFLDAIQLIQAVFMGKESFFESGDEHRMELEPLRRMDRHQLQRRTSLGGLRIARLQSSVRKKCR